MNIIPIKLGSQTLQFEQHFINANWNKVPLIYMFFADWADGRINPAIPYIGETGDATSRLPDHDRWEDAVRDYGATHVLAKVAPHNLEARRDLERTLIRAYNPPMNTQHKPDTYFGGLAAAALTPNTLSSFASLASSSPVNSLAAGLFGSFFGLPVDPSPPAVDWAWLASLQPTQTNHLNGALNDYSADALRGLFGLGGALGHKF